MAEFTIQNPVTAQTRPIMSQICVASSGRLYVTYRHTVGPTTYQAIAYSDDVGQTWTEINDSSFSGFSNPSIAIDSQDKLHIAYLSTTQIVSYVTFSAGVFGTPETIHDGTVGTDAANHLDLALDSVDVPHVAWEQDTPSGTDNHIYYSNRSGGTWAARTQITSTAVGLNESHIRVLIDSTGIIYLVWRSLTGGGSNLCIQYARYISSWLGPVLLADEFGTNIGYQFSAVIDSSNNLHIVFNDTSTNPDELRYMKYTKATDSWSTESVLVSSNTTVPDNGDPISMGIDASGNLQVIWQKSNEIYYMTYTGSWSAPAVILTPTYTRPTFNTPVFPVLEGVSTQIPVTGYMLTALTNGANKFYSSANLDLQTPLNKNYSSEDAAALPAADANLDNLFTSSEYSDVATTDDVFSTQSATDEYSIFLFKNKGNSSSDNIVVTWIGQSSIAPSTSTIYLQIYNRNSATWETLASNSTTSANTTFSLSGTKTSSLSNYYDGSNWVSCRVYQLAA